MSSDDIAKAPAALQTLEDKTHHAEEIRRHTETIRQNIATLDMFLRPECEGEDIAIDRASKAISKALDKIIEATNQQ